MTNQPATVATVATLDTYGGSEGTLTTAEVTQHIQLIQAVMRRSMKRDVHYGVIPGTKRPSLWKPGAELILTTFRLGAEPIQVDEGGEGYRVTLRVFHIPTGNTVGYGLGSCSWAEDKYAWRKAVHPKEYEAAAPNDRRIKHYKNGDAVKQVHTNPADYYNTALKMAKKRALVDGCLTCTAASDAFDQDLEQVPPEDLNRESNGTVTNESQAPRPDEAKLLQAIEAASNVDELAALIDAVNAVPGKAKISIGSVYRKRVTELGPKGDE
jgi:hypothetical protein